MNKLHTTPPLQPQLHQPQGRLTKANLALETQKVNEPKVLYGCTNVTPSERFLSKEINGIEHTGDLVGTDPMSMSAALWRLPVAGAKKHTMGREPPLLELKSGC